MSRHWELGPHGDGTQGSNTIGAVGRGGGATRTQVSNGQAPQILISHTHKVTLKSDSLTPQQKSTGVTAYVGW